MNTDPHIIKECLQGDCNVILRDHLYSMDDERHAHLNVCDLDVDAVLEMPLTRLNYGRTQKPQTNEVIPRTPEAETSRGFVKFLFEK